MGVEGGGSGGGPGSARRDRGGAQSVAFEGQVADEPGFSQLSHARRRGQGDAMQIYHELRRGGLAGQWSEHYNCLAVKYCLLHVQ